MKSIFGALTLSIVASFLLVNASAEGSSPANKATTSRAGHSNTGTPAGHLIDYMFKNGEDAMVKSHSAAHLGLPGPRPEKGKIVSSSEDSARSTTLDVGVIYEETRVQESSAPPQRRPLYIYLRRIRRDLTSHRMETNDYLVSSKGDLEKAWSSTATLNEQGKAIHGSSVDAPPRDVKSKEVHEAFSAEWKEVTTWLQKQEAATPAAK